MQNLVSDTVKSFFTKCADVIIEGESYKTFNKPGISVTLKSNNNKYFVLIVSNQEKYDWFVHFENFSDEPYTDKEKDILLTALSAIVDAGEVVTTEGGVTPGGISAIKKLCDKGFTKIGTNSGKRVQWAPTLIDFSKFCKWISSADKEDYKHNDKTNWPNLDNTSPVVWVIRKNK